MSRWILTLLVLPLVLCGTCSRALTTQEKLSTWRQGVWLLGGGGRAIYTDAHYFVLTASGDSARVNLYCGTSLLRYTEKGIARKQILRVRQSPGRELQLVSESLGEWSEEVLEIDMDQFQAGTCTLHEGILYDSVIEETDEYILLATCNGDRERIYADGRSVYLPAGGGEFWAYRIETWSEAQALPIEMASGGE